MILKGSQRGGARQLAAHLLNLKDNDHVDLVDLRGFVTDNLAGAFDEARAVSRGTRCQQFLFSLSLNPPQGADASRDALLLAADRAGEALGLQDQPRAVIIHEKNGRRHAHAVWSRIDAEQMKAINLPHFKNKLRELSKELYLEHGWELPDGHKTNGWRNPLNFTLAEWQQAKRLDLDPREVKQVFRSAWARSDNLPSLRNALEEHGFFLAKGDRRGVVAMDINGGIFSFSRWSGVKTKDLAQKIGRGAELLPGVEDVRRSIDKRMSSQLRELIAQDRQRRRQKLAPLLEARQEMTKAHREEREFLLARQKSRHREESHERAQRFRRGFGAAMDYLTGRVFETRRTNEREAYQCMVRDKSQRETLFNAQIKERASLQTRIAAVQKQDRAERALIARHVVHYWRTARQRPERQQGHEMELHL